MSKFVIIVFFIFTTASSPVSSSTIQGFRNCMETNGIWPEFIVEQSVNPNYYNLLNDQWNTRLLRVYPVAYFLPTNTKDVQQAVKCGVRSNIRLIPKCGGHSYESYSFGTNQSLILDFRKMNQVVVDNSSNKTATAVIGPGTLLGEAVVKLWYGGGYGIPVGDFVTVGVGGQALGGGVGYFSHKYGLTLDSLIEMEMVDAKGDIHVVNNEENSDLFWGLRGIGPGFIGLVTKFKFKLFKASELKINYVKLVYNIRDILECMNAWQEWFAWTIKNDPSIYSHLSMEDGNEILIQFVYIEDKDTKPEQIKTLLKSLKIIFSSNVTLSYSVLPYMDFVLATSGASIPAPSAKLTELDLLNARNLGNLPRFVKMKTFLVTKFADSTTMEKLVDVIRRISRSVGFYSSSEHGAIRDVSAASTSYVHRNSLFSIEVLYSGSSAPTEVQDWNDWLLEMWNVTRTLDSGETYQNYVDSDLEDYLKRYYGANLPRLMKIKRTWDPQNYFQSSQSLPVLANAASVSLYSYLSLILLLLSIFFNLNVKASWV